MLCAQAVGSETLRTQYFFFTLVEPRYARDREAAVSLQHFDHGFRNEVLARYRANARPQFLHVAALD